MLSLLSINTKVIISDTNDYSLVFLHIYDSIMFGGLMLNTLDK